MASLVIRQLPDSVKAKLKERAAQHGRSMEEEARDILKCAVGIREPKHNLAEAMRLRFAEFGGVELPEIPDVPIPDPPDFT